ncbi:MAG: hypothetical protein R2932_48850 [Caldilineaceae bacterium]
MARVQTAAPAVPPMDLASASTNRLLIQGVDGNLFTIAPDGTGRISLTDDGGTNTIYTQPTWSSNGERMAWTAIERSSGNSQLITTLANGTARTSAETPYPPFYLYWSPDDSKVAYLSNWPINNNSSIALRIVDIAAGGERATTVDTGQPYYFSWAPTSEQIVAHVGNRQVRLLDLTTLDADSAPTILLDDSANFAAPQWYAPQSGAAELVSGQLLYVIDDSNTAQLVVSDIAGEDQQFLTYLSRQDFVSFNLNANGSRVAYIETTDFVGLNSFGPLFVYDLQEEIFEQISTDPAIAFFWSPDGGSLFYLTVEPVDGNPWLRVNVWNGRVVQQFDRFVPSPSFLRDYLRFADQYVQSMRFWAPDIAVVYAGKPKMAPPACGYSR